MPMHKRILCVLLSALTLLSLIPAIALPSQAASHMNTSEACIQILKDMEGFIEKPMYDNGHYSVGYGSSCEKDDYPDGITEEEADALLREFIEDMEEDLNNFSARFKFILNQNQFDALMLFTYNCGSGWMYSDGTFRTAVIEGKTGNSYIFALTQWTYADGGLSLGLVNRRLIEADMYLNGSYANKRPSHYTYVTFDNNEGVGQVRVQGYDCDLIAYVQSLPTREGHRFLGWYTAAEGGSWVTELTVANAEQMLYAHWLPEDSSGVAARYQVSADRLATLSYYDAPGGNVSGTLSADTIATVVADFVDANGVKWGLLENNGWVNLGDPRIGTADETEQIQGVKVTVTGDYVNVRRGPGTDYDVIAAALAGDEIFITETRLVEDVLWGKFRAGWLCLAYTDYEGGLTPDAPGDVPELPDPEEETVIATGVVTATELNIRAAAGTHGYLMGCYKRGDHIKIYEKTQVNSVWWGRTEKGWVCLTYVELDEDVVEIPETTEPETTAPPEETTQPEPAPEETLPQPEVPEEDPDQGIPATVISKTGLNIRAGAGTRYLSVGSYKPGDKIRILEQTTVDGVNWGRTNKGWVCMTYVQLEQVWSDENGVHGTVTSTAGLNIRSGPGVNHPPVGSYPYGEKILVYEQTVVSGQKWGRTDRGWVCMDYVKLEAAADTPDPEPTQPETPTEPAPTEPEMPAPEQNAQLTGTVTASGLNIRKTPGTNGALVGGYSRGDRVVILEQANVNGTIWGRTDLGWISLAYVQLDTNQNGAGRRVTIAADILCIRKGPGTGNAILGTYIRGEQVIILETAKVGATTWGRTDKGWICMDYVK